jgi:hypothetical protein
MAISAAAAYNSDAFAGPTASRFVRAASPHPAVEASEIDEAFYYASLDIIDSYHVPAAGEGTAVDAPAAEDGMVVDESSALPGQRCACWGALYPH